MVIVLDDKEMVQEGFSNSSFCTCGASVHLGSSSRWACSSLEPSQLNEFLKAALLKTGRVMPVVGGQRED